MTSKTLLKRQQFIVILTAALALLQIPLWIGTGSVFSLIHTYYEQYQIIQENGRLHLMNEQIEDKIAALQKGTAEINARARLELGMVGANETYYQVMKQ